MIPVPQGYSFAVAQAGFKTEGRFDLGLILSEVPAVTAGLFTTNRFQAAPVRYCLDSLAERTEFRGVVVNSGQANACTGEEGYVNCRVSLEMTAEAAGVKPEDLLPCSTGVIGPHLRLNRWKAAAPQLTESLPTAGPMDVAKAIMTTDSFPKVAWSSVRLGDSEARVLGFAKGAGMICPNMATMLAFIITDAQVGQAAWRDMLGHAVRNSFNRITVDGDTSTNDTVLGMANGASGLSVEGLGQQALTDAVFDVCQALSYMIVQDAEGGTKVARIRVVGAKDDEQAEQAARAVGNSPLVKTALFGQDANWGRIVCALGYSGAEFDPEQVRVAIGSIAVFENGKPVQGDLDSLLAPHMKRQDISLRIRLGDGPGEYTVLASDLTHEYVSINADYRS